MVTSAAEAIEVALEPPPHSLCDDWRVATALTRSNVDERGFGAYTAADYDELLDHPVEPVDPDDVALAVLALGEDDDPHQVVADDLLAGDGERRADQGSAGSVGFDEQDVATGHAASPTAALLGREG